LSSRLVTIFSKSTPERSTFAPNIGKPSLAVTAAKKGYVRPMNLLAFRSHFFLVSFVSPTTFVSESRNADRRIASHTNRMSSGIKLPKFIVNKEFPNANRPCGGSGDLCRVSMRIP
uniref:Secreted protein n=1 Tax=Haemonchus placei TaxID=6290 RepID=A0A0N4W7L2_HAEPC